MTNKGLARNVRIIVFWNAQEVTLIAMHFTTQCIHCCVSMQNETFQGYLSFIYDSNAATEITDLWGMLAELSGTMASSGECTYGGRGENY